MKKNALLIALLLLVLLSGIAYAAYSYTSRVATTVNVVSVPLDVGLEVMPASLTLDTAPGETSIVQVAVKNIGVDTLRSVVMDVEGAPAGWVLKSTGNRGLAPGESADIQVWLTVPADQVAGTFTFSLVFLGVR